MAAERATPSKVDSPHAISVPGNVDMAPSVPLPEVTASPATPDAGNPECLHSSNGHSAELPEPPPPAPVKPLVSILHKPKSAQASTRGAPVVQGQSDDTRDGNGNAEEPVGQGSDSLQGKRSVQWNDIHGKELAQVWEFEAR